MLTCDLRFAIDYTLLAMNRNRVLSGRETDPVMDPLLQEAAEIAGDRWVLLALGALRDGPRRFGDLVGDLGGIAPNILIDRLRRMERHGLLAAALYSQRPRRFVYDLTESGRELAALLPVLTTWVARRSGGEPHRHSACGSALEVRLWCPTCAATVDDGSVVAPADRSGDATGATDDGRGDDGLRWL